MRIHAPNWLLQVTWFIAGVFGTGAFWYYLSQNNSVLTWVSAAGAVLFAVLAIGLHILSEAKPTEHVGNAEDLRASRRTRISEWRNAVEELGAGFRDERRLHKFLSSSVYSAMRPHLLPDVVSKVERPRTAYVGGSRGDDVLKYTLLDDIARIEREWGLV